MLGLVANVWQMVDATDKLWRITVQIAQTGVSEEFATLEKEMQRLTVFSEDLGKDSTRFAPEFKELSSEARQVSVELLGILNKCKSSADADRSPLDSFKRAVKSQLNRSAIATLRDRLRSIAQQAHILEHHQLCGHMSEQLKHHGERPAGLVSDSDDKLRSLMKAALRKDRKAVEVVASHHILFQLRFPEIHSRHLQLEQHSPHRKSYSWLFDVPGTGTAVSNPSPFEAWLTSTRKLFWVSGKAASGKSTLLKHLCSDSETQQKLLLWAGDKKLLKSSFFFWEVGKVPLLTQSEGLFRTLLYQILQQSPELVPNVYPEQWAGLDKIGHVPLTGDTDYLDSAVNSLRESLQIHTDRVQGMIETLEKACHAMVRHQCCLFMVIDGLDEHESDDPTEVIGLIDRLTALPDVKICVSSRSEGTSVHARANMTDEITLEHHNLMDIESYVRDRLQNHEQFKELGHRGPELIDKVTRDSRGIFLWAELVTKELVEGLSHCDNRTKLEERLKELPPILLGIYSGMLDRVADIDKVDSATMLLVTRYSHHRLSPLACWFIYERFEQPLEPQRLPELHRVNAQICTFRVKRRLQAHCKGLLEIEGLGSGDNREPMRSNSEAPKPLVTFMHRTVQDFLKVPKEHQRLNEWIGADFHVDELICQALCAELRSFDSQGSDFDSNGPVANLLETFAFHCARLNRSDPLGSSAKNLQKHLEAILKVHDKVQKHSFRARPLPSPIVDSVRHGMKALKPQARSSKRGNITASSSGSKPENAKQGSNGR